MDPRTEIAQIDRQIDDVTANLKYLEPALDELSAGSWQDAWDKHPSLAAHFRSLYRLRGAAQDRRDILEQRAVKAAKRRLRAAVIPPARQCPTCGSFTRNAAQPQSPHRARMTMDTQDSKAEMRYCDQCRWFSHDGSGVRFGRCKNPKSQKPISGDAFLSASLNIAPEYHFAGTMRAEHHCGRDARWFEPAPASSQEAA